MKRSPSLRCPPTLAQATAHGPHGDAVTAAALHTSATPISRPSSISPTQVARCHGLSRSPSKGRRHWSSAGHRGSGAQTALLALRERDVVDRKCGARREGGTAAGVAVHVLVQRPASLDESGVCEVASDLVLVWSFGPVGVFNPVFQPLKVELVKHFL